MGAASKDYRIAILDIENFPNVGFAWEQREAHPSHQNLIDVSRPWNIASFAVKWDGDKGLPTCLSLPDFKKTYRKDPFDDSELLRELHAVLDRAHLVVGHNVKRFDLRKIRARMFKHHHQPPSPFKVYDTLTEARSLGMFPSNRLGDLAKFLGCPYGGKVEHEGFPMWLKCMNGDMEAWGRMVKYNIQDVRINEWVYHRLRPWSTTHPNITIESGLSYRCPSCGGRTISRGFNNLRTYRTRRYQCLAPKCGKWSSGEREKLQAVLLQ